MNEIDRIYERYRERDFKGGRSQIQDSLFEKFKNAEREKVYEKIFLMHFGKFYTELDLLEIGAGSGKNIGFFRNIGFKPDRIWANELLPWRIKELKELYPDIHYIEGDALTINTSRKFDVVFQSLVFSSILDSELRNLLANKMMELLKPGGVIIWYDFIYDNPWNSGVKGINRKEIRLLFPGAKLRFWPVTLVPPVGRKFSRFYNIINGFCPFLRTHIVGEITIQSV